MVHYPIDDKMEAEMEQLEDNWDDFTAQLKESSIDIKKYFQEKMKKLKMAD